MLGSPEPPRLDASAEDVRRSLADHVHVRLAGVDVGAGDEAAAERREQVAVALEQPPPLLAFRHGRHREHRLPASAVEPEHCELARHAGGQTHRILECLGRGRVGVQARAAHRRAEPRGVQANEHPRTGRSVVPHDRVLPVPPLEQVLEHERGLYPPDSARESRSRPASSVSSATASESRAWPRPRSPKPSPGASATRASSQQPFRRPARRAAAARRRTCRHSAAPARAARRRRGRGAPRTAPAARRPSPAARQRGDRRPLERDEDPGADVLLQPGHARDQLGVPEHEAEPPARHPVALREREELDADLPRAGLRQEARRRAAVEDEIAVREVVQDRGAGPLREADRLREHALGRSGRRSDSTGS